MIYQNIIQNILFVNGELKTGKNAGFNLWCTQRDSLDTSYLRGNRNDFGAFHFQNLLVVEPVVAFATFSVRLPWVITTQTKPTTSADFNLWCTQRWA